MNIELASLTFALLKVLSFGEYVRIDVKKLGSFAAENRENETDKRLQTTMRNEGTRG